LDWNIMNTTALGFKQRETLQSLMGKIGERVLETAFVNGGGKLMLELNIPPHGIPRDFDVLVAEKRP